MTTSSARPAIARPLRRANLEVSLKPFPSFDDAAVTATVRTLFDQWRTLLATAQECSVLLWVSDGSEILDWAGDLTDELEWARFIGFNNTAASAYGEEKEPERVAIPYRAGTGPITYADVARVVAAIKAAGAEAGIPTRVGATFDPGPEFAPSDFKFTRHPEVVARGEDVGIGPIIAMVRHFSVLEGDDRPYAAFPAGIPAGTSFGELLGRQSEDYLRALGFDYLWLSNGFGFSSYAWSELGESFDGARFRPERTGDLRERALGFWADLAAHLTYPVQVRGTNHTAGIDIGADSVPALEVYERGYLESPPPNSPWGPLNEDFGIELSGLMSRVAVLPAGAQGFRFRFYANDPWFWQQPWWDFYHREPFDIYLPLAVARLRADGSVEPASEVNVLTVDTAHGVLDERCGREVGTHVATALEALPDEAGPVVWVYPFREYHEAMAADPTTIGRPHFEDWYLTAAINAGLPLNTVVSTDDLAGAMAAGALAGRTLVVPVGALSEPVARVLAGHVRGGGTLIAYGALDGASSAARGLLGVAVDDNGLDGLDGDLTLVSTLGSDVVPGGALPTTVRHVPHLSGGPVREVAAPGTQVLASVTDRRPARPARMAPGPAGQARAYATARPLGAGEVRWVRGSSPFRYADPDAQGRRAHVPHDRAALADPAALLRDLLRRGGLHVAHELRTPAAGRAVHAVHRSAGAYWFTGYLPDTTTRLSLALPAGAPLLNHQECWYDGATATYQLPKSFRAECRVLVDQATAGVLRCREIAPYPAHMTRAMRVTGLVDATVTLLLPPSAAEVRVDVDDVPFDLDELATADDVRRASGAAARHLTGVTGTLTLAWEER